MANPWQGNQRNGSKVTVGSEAIYIEGLSDFNRALRAVDAEYPKAMRRAGYGLARGLVLAARAQATGMSIRTGSKAARSLRAGTTASNAYVQGGGARYPYFYGAEFGSKRYGQFQSWRGNQWGGWDGGPGYFLHPAIRKQGPALLRVYMAELDRLTDQAFPG